MATVTYEQLFSSPVVTRVISTIKTPQSRLQDFFGCGPGGGNVNPVGGEVASWDIFDKTRAIAKGRARGTGPGTVAAQPIGHKTVQFYRSHEKIHIPDDKIFRKRQLGGQYGEIDISGQNYVTRQEGVLAQRLRNNREFMIAKMLTKGGFGLFQLGDDWLPVDLGTDTAGTDYHFKVVFDIPTDQVGTLSSISSVFGADTTSWATTASANIIQTCLGINAGFEELHGRPLRHAWCNSKTIQYVINNTGMKGAAGTSNIVWESWQRSTFTGPDGMVDTGFEVVFKALPWLTWHVYDAGLDMWAKEGTSTYTKFFPDDRVVFLPDPSSDWFEYQEGSEWVRENKMDTGSERYGIAAWSEVVTQPSGSEIITLDNGLPILYVPKCVLSVDVTP